MFVPSVDASLHCSGEGKKLLQYSTALVPFYRVSLSGDKRSRDVPSSYLPTYLTYHT